MEGQQVNYTITVTIGDDGDLGECPLGQDYFIRVELNKGTDGPECDPIPARPMTQIYRQCKSTPYDCFNLSNGVTLQEIDPNQCTGGFVTVSS